MDKTNHRAHLSRSGVAALSTCRMNDPGNGDAGAPMWIEVGSAIEDDDDDDNDDDEEDSDVLPDCATICPDEVNNMHHIEDMRPSFCNLAF